MLPARAPPGGCGAARSTPSPTGSSASTAARLGIDPGFSILDQGDAVELFGFVRHDLGLSHVRGRPPLPPAGHAGRRLRQGRQHRRAAAGRPRAVVPVVRQGGRRHPGRLRGLRRPQARAPAPRLRRPAPVLAGARRRARAAAPGCSTTCSSTSTRTPTPSRPTSSPPCVPTAPASPWWATTPRPSTASAPPAAATSSPSPTGSPAPPSCAWSRTTAPPRPSSPWPTPSWPRPLPARSWPQGAWPHGAVVEGRRHPPAAAAHLRRRDGRGRGGVRLGAGPPGGRRGPPRPGRAVPGLPPRRPARARSWSAATSPT